MDVDENLVTQLDDVVPPFSFPALPGSVASARATVLQVLGNARAARLQYLRQVFVGPNRRNAVGQSVRLTLNHGGRPTAAVLAVGRRLPPVGPLRGAREVAELKRASILFNLGRHDAVERATRNLPAEAISTLLVLRAGSLRMTSSLDDAIDIGTEALRRARAEKHQTRAANAALQLAIALVWAGQLDQAETHLHEQMRPLASVAATRWVAWADFVETLVHIHRGRASDALAVIEIGLARFRAEGLLDGVLGMETVRLTAQRLAGDDVAFVRQRMEIERFFGRRASGPGRHYTRGHRFSREAVLLEDAEFARTHQQDLDRAGALYSQVADSAYKVHAALANIGLASVAVGRDELPSQADEAARLGLAIGALLVVGKANGLTAGEPPLELFFP